MEKRRRYLISHPESSSLFEKFMTEDEAYDFFFDNDGLAADVTGIEEWERRFINGTRFFLFFDTETTGLPKNWSAKISDLDNWPRLVQLAWELYSEEGKLIEADSSIVIPEGFEIPKQASDIHGISTERAMREGKPLRDVIGKFYNRVAAASVLIGHNVSFDVKITAAEILRLGLPFIKPARPKICTMNSAVNYCRIPGPRGFKWPKLVELHRKLFGCDFDGAHDATFDVRATVKCFWELKRLGVIKI